MTAEEILLDGASFRSIQVSEEVLEGMLRSWGREIFGGLQYFDFRPAIPGPHGTRHPDGILLAPGCERWWVVEVEIHTHSVDDHIAPQLSGLADGVYGYEAFRYLERNLSIDTDDYDGLDVWNPSFLLVIDHLTPQIRRAADNASFAITEIGVYRSAMSQYALALNGARPRPFRSSLPPGVDVAAIDEQGVCVLIPLGNRSLPPSTGNPLMVGSREVQQRRTAVGQIALPLRVADVHNSLGICERYRLTIDDRLLAVEPTSA